MKDIKKRDHLNDMLLEAAPEINMHATMFAKSGNYPKLQAEDLHSIGQHGLYEAIASFDPSKGASFKTHASNSIKNKMRQHLKNYSEVDDLHRTSAKKIKPKGPITTED